MITKSGVATNALVVIAVLVTAYAMYWFRGILSPLVLAVFLAVMIDGLARLLAHRVPFLPEWAALPVSILLTTLTFGLVVYGVASNAAGFATRLLSDTARLNLVIAEVTGAFGVRVPPTVAQLLAQLNPTRYIADLARAFQSFASGAIYVFIYLGFLIASRQGFRRKVVNLFPSHEERDHAVAVFLRIRNGIERYLWLQTVSCFLIALLSGIVMAALGLSDALFWAFLIFVVCYIPVVGGLVAGFLPPLFALVQFPTYWQAVVLFGALQIIMFAVGNVLLPKMQKDSLNIDPVVVLLSLAVWGALWGVPGMFLSTPLTVTAIIVLAQFQGSRWIAVLLSGDGEPESEPVLPRPALAAPSPAPAE